MRNNIFNNKKENQERSEKVDLGFLKVFPEEKIQSVKNIFQRVAPKYDLMNDVMSLGLHKNWKRWFVSSLPLGNSKQYLDVAGGTGDIALSIARRLNTLNLKGEILICDNNLQMIDEGRKKDKALVEWCCGSAEELPFLDSSVDLYTIAFGLRNVARLEKALEEAYRVLKPGGMFACLEFSQVIQPLRFLYDWYSFHIIPFLGEKIANDREAYVYLAESIKKFPTQKTLAKLMEKAGFKQVSFTDYSAGIVSFHQGYKN